MSENQPTEKKNKPSISPWLQNLFWIAGIITIAFTIGRYVGIVKFDKEKLELQERVNELERKLSNGGNGDNHQASNETALNFKIEKECEFPDEHTVGKMIFRSNASSERVHGQLGCEGEFGYAAKSGYVEFDKINLPNLNSAVIKIRYSKNSSPIAPIEIFLNQEAAPRNSFMPKFTGDWNNFQWTEEIPLARIKSGIYSLRFYTRGQDYGVADLDKFEIYQQN